MLQFLKNRASTSKTRRPTGRRATMEPMEGRVLMSATTLGDQVTFTYVVTNTSPAVNFTPDGKQLVISIKD